jgi:hypothetical protein
MGFIIAGILFQLLAGTVQKSPALVLLYRTEPKKALKKKN